MGKLCRIWWLDIIKVNHSKPPSMGKLCRISWLDIIKVKHSKPSSMGISWSGLDHIEHKVKQSEGSSYTRARMLVAGVLAIKNKQEPNEFRFTSNIESWHLACSNYRQCYRVLLCVDNGKFFINTWCFKFGLTLAPPLFQGRDKDHTWM